MKKQRDKNSQKLTNISKMLFCSNPNQEGAEEYEGDEVAVSKVSPTASLVVWRHGEGGDGGIWFTLLPRQT